MSLFARLLTVQLENGIPLMRGLEALSQQIDDPVFAGVVSRMATRVSGGCSLSAAASEYPKIFSKVFVGLVHTGETTGALVGSLNRLALMLENEHKLYSRVHSAFVYPIFVLVLTLVLTLFVFYTILPNFILIFRSMNVPLPLITRVLVAITEGLRNPGCWLVAAGLAMMAQLSFQRLVSEPEGRLKAYQMLLSVPVVGAIVRYASLARYFWVMESTVGCGIDLLKSVRLSAGASGSPELEDHAESVCEALRSGEELSRQYALRKDIYTRLAGHMVGASEESSDMQSSFAYLARWFSQEMDVRVDLLNALIEPLLMAFVALIVGTIVVAIFLPLYGFLGSMGA